MQHKKTALTMDKSGKKNKKIQFYNFEK